MKPVTVLVEPRQGADVVQSKEYARLVDELSAAMDTDVALQVGGLADLPPAGGWVLADLSSAVAPALQADPSLAKRLILLGTSRATMVDQMRELGVLASVGQGELNCWRLSRNIPHGDGVLGWLEPARAAGLMVGPIRQVEGVGWLYGGALPEVLAAYLKAVR